MKSEKAREVKLENVQAYVDSLKYFEQEEGASLTDFLSSTVIDRKSDKENDLDQLNLMTFHSAKGLEFPAVFLVGLEDHLIPHFRSQKKDLRFSKIEILKLLKFHLEHLQKVVVISEHLPL